MPDETPLGTTDFDIPSVMRRAFPDLPEGGGGPLLVGLIGAGIQQSRTPGMQEAEAAAVGLDLEYRLLDLDRLDLPSEAVGALIEWAGSKGFAGLNITHPCKQLAVAHMDALSDDARAIGAINTVVFAGGRRVGHNTDCSGFGESFRREGAGFRRRRVVLLGAGGAGSAVARALLLNGVGSLAIFDIVGARAERLATDLRQAFGPAAAEVVTNLPGALASADGLVNTTPIGTDKHPGIPLDPMLLRPDHWVADINYFQTRTELLAAAETTGCRTIAGKGMAVFQAAHAFELFSARKPDPDRMARHFDRHSAGGN